MTENTAIKIFPKKSKKPLQAIRFFCFECMGWDRRQQDSDKPFEDVKECTDLMCPLYEFRFGKNPFFKKSPLSKEHLNKLRSGLKTSQRKERIEQESTKLHN